MATRHLRLGHAASIFRPAKRCGQRRQRLVTFLEPRPTKAVEDEDENEAPSALSPQRNERRKPRLAKINAGPDHDSEVDWCEDIREEWIAMAHVSGDCSAEVTGQ